MIDVKNKKCIYINSLKQPLFNLPSEKTAIYCIEHKKENMIDVKHKRCIHINCMKSPTLNLSNETIAIYSLEHKKEKMINKNNKKEWSIVRYLRKAINTKFEYNSSKMLQGCSKKRPDIYFELLNHCLIVEIDEYQHNTYEDICECARINEIVNGIGGKSIIFIRYNPDKIKNNDKEIIIKNSERLDLLVRKIKEELIKPYEEFVVKIIQKYYNDNYEKYEAIKEEIITDLVCI